MAYDEHIPTPEEIAEMCALFRLEWADRQTPGGTGRTSRRAPSIPAEREPERLKGSSTTTRTETMEECIVPPPVSAPVRLRS